MTGEYPILTEGEKEAVRIAQYLDNFTAQIHKIAASLASPYFPVEATATNALALGHLSMAQFHIDTAREMLNIQQQSTKDLVNATTKQKDDDGNGATIL